LILDRPKNEAYINETHQKSVIEFDSYAVIVDKENKCGLFTPFLISSTQCFVHNWVITGSFEERNFSCQIPLPNEILEKIDQNWELSHQVADVKWQTWVINITMLCSIHI
jgi:hypothetical protein